MGEFTFAVVVVAVAITAALLSRRPPRQHHEYQTIHAIWTQQELDEIADSIRNSYKEFPNTVKDVTSALESVGEELPMENGKCTNPLMVPSLDGAQCVFAQRMDIGRHYIMTGGNDALKELYPTLVSRIMSFSKFIISRDQSEAALYEGIPFIKKLFGNEQYKQGISRICPNRELLQPFQLGVIVQVPGQTVAMHYDAPWFWGADRTTVPIWLLVVMHASGLFEKETVPQIQGVAYVHKWNTTDLSDEDIHRNYGGGFFFYPNGPQYEEERIAARPGSALLIDGSKCIHGTDTYRDGDDMEAPKLDKNDNFTLQYNTELNTDETPTKDTVWNVLCNGEVIRSVTFSQLRISLVWRSKCFKDEEELQRYKNTPPMELDDIIARLKSDLEEKNILSNDQNITMAELGKVFLDTYVDYPLPASWVPYNYCALPRLFGADDTSPLTSAMKLFCN
eukprot:m.76446 g.76446  ORF g.76446 m.76446 type:complete len:450 (-) comp11881_c0_seq1:53-1402(-)